jgi:hypothetical protein
MIKNEFDRILATLRYTIVYRCVIPPYDLLL